MFNINSTTNPTKINIRITDPEREPTPEELELQARRLELQAAILRAQAELARLEGGADD